MSCHLPIDCVLAITYKCNSRCTMCDIWRITDHRDIAPAEYLKLPASLRDVNISGGEPFMRTDIAEIIANVKSACPKARIVISSNGFATDLIVRRMKEVLSVKRDIGVAISIDGIGDLHDAIRGIPGGFQKAMATVKALQALRMTNLRLAFTILKQNITHFSKVYDLSRELGIQFTHSFAQSSDFYFGGKQNTDNHPRRELMDKEYKYIIGKELQTWAPKRWARAFFAHGMQEFITSKEPVLSNAPGRDFFFMDPGGVIYPSVVHNVVMGNICEVKSHKSKVISLQTSPPAPFLRGEGGSSSTSLSLGRGIEGEGQKVWISFEQFWCSKETEESRQKVDSLKMPVWMICTARTAIKRHPVKILAWVMTHKLYL